MKWQTLIILVVIAFNVLSPLSVHLTVEYGQTTTIGSFDICHAGSVGIATGHEMPCYTENPCVLIPLYSLARTETPSSLIKPLIIAFQDERPPKA